MGKKKKIQTWPKHKKKKWNIAFWSKKKKKPKKKGRPKIRRR